MNIEKTCCFTGKRPQSMPFGFNEADSKCVDLKNKLYTQIELAIKKGYTHFISGMALGADLWAAEAVLNLKKTYPAIELICAIPYPNQAYSWPFEQKKRYSNCLKYSSEKVYIRSTYTTDCFFARNRYMVDKSSLVIAICDTPPTGGTAYTLNYAKKQGKKINIIEI